MDSETPREFGEVHLCICLKDYFQREWTGWKLYITVRGTIPSAGIPDYKNVKIMKPTESQYSVLILREQPECHTSCQEELHHFKLWTKDTLLSLSYFCQIYSLTYEKSKYYKRLSCSAFHGFIVFHPVLLWTLEEMLL